MDGWLDPQNISYHYRLWVAQKIFAYGFFKYRVVQHVRSLSDVLECMIAVKDVYVVVAAAVGVVGDVIGKNEVGKLVGRSDVEQVGSFRLYGVHPLFGKRFVGYFDAQQVAVEQIV